MQPTEYDGHRDRRALTPAQRCTDNQDEEQGVGRFIVEARRCDSDGKGEREQHRGDQASTAREEAREDEIGRRCGRGRHRAPKGLCGSEGRGTCADPREEKRNARRAKGEVFFEGFAGDDLLRPRRPNGRITFIEHRVRPRCIGCVREERQSQRQNNEENHARNQNIAKAETALLARRGPLALLLVLRRDDS